ncbi:MAG: hypothetical protein JJE17_10935, partial [Peptostreptococcaceae bacterium]|nr:hypothetical protein [Peptostreptococcaceae bacterium]
LSKAHRVLGILEGMTRFIPNMDVTESILMKKEILLSCQLDGSKASFDDVLHNTKKKNKDIIYIQQFRNIRRKKHEKIYGYDFGLVLGFLVRDDSICSNWI